MRPTDEAIAEAVRLASLIAQGYSPIPKHTATAILDLLQPTEGQRAEPGIVSDATIREAVGRLGALLEIDVPIDTEIMNIINTLIGGKEEADEGRMNSSCQCYSCVEYRAIHAKGGES